MERWGEGDDSRGGILRRFMRRRKRKREEKEMWGDDSREGRKWKPKENERKSKKCVWNENSNNNNNDQEWKKKNWWPAITSRKKLVAQLTMILSCQKTKLHSLQCICLVYTNTHNFVVCIVVLPIYILINGSNSLKSISENTTGENISRLF